MFEIREIYEAVSWGDDAEKITSAINENKSKDVLEMLSDIREMLRLGTLYQIEEWATVPVRLVREILDGINGMYDFLIEKCINYSKDIDLLYEDIHIKDEDISRLQDEEALLTKEVFHLECLVKELRKEIEDNKPQPINITTNESVSPDFSRIINSHDFPYDLERRAKFFSEQIEIELVTIQDIYDNGHIILNYVLRKRSARVHYKRLSKHLVRLGYPVKAWMWFNVIHMSQQLREVLESTGLCSLHEITEYTFDKALVLLGNDKFLLDELIRVLYDNDLWLAGSYGSPLTSSEIISKHKLRVTLEKLDLHCAVMEDLELQNIKGMNKLLKMSRQDLRDSGIISCEFVEKEITNKLFDKGRHLRCDKIIKCRDCGKFFVAFENDPHAVQKLCTECALEQVYINIRNKNTDKEC